MLEREGYEILKEVFSHEEVDSMRKLILSHRTPSTYLSRLACRMLVSYVGDEVIDFMSKVDIARWNMLSRMLNSRLLPLVHQKFGDDLDFGFHNDIGINMVNAWHKDILGNGVRIALIHNTPLAKFETEDLWKITADGSKYEIYKCCIYLNTSNRNDGLRIVPKSQNDRHITPDRVKNHVVVRPKPGDVLLFDQRVTHKGVQSESFSMEDRVLVSIGFGRQNIFTNNFARGTCYRQNIQNRWMSRAEAIPWNAAAIALIVVFGMFGSFSAAVFAMVSLMAFVTGIELLLLVIKVVVYSTAIHAKY